MLFELNYCDRRGMGCARGKAGATPVRFSIFDFRCSMFDVRCSMLNVRCLTFGFPERRRLEQIEFSVFQNNNVRNLIRYTVTNSNTICKKVPYIILTVKSTESTGCEENLNESIPILSVSHMSTTYQNSLGAGKERRTLRQHNYLKKRQHPSLELR